MNDIDPIDLLINPPIGHCPVSKPKHYSILDGKYEVIHLIEDRLKALQHSKYRPDNPIIYSNYANLVKYSMRWFHKGGLEDLRKAREYIDFILREYDVKD